MKGLVKKIKADTAIFKQGEASSELIFLISGKLLVCTIQGTQVKVISRIGPGEFVGELSFFDGLERASHVITIEDSEIVSFPKNELYFHLPLWHREIHKNLTKKIRALDQIVHEHSIRKSSSEEQKPLTIEEQRKILALIKN